MGFYDYRCHATGLSLRAEKAAVVLLLEETKGVWVPASLPLFGTYNRLGTIDSVQADFHTQLVDEAFRASVESKRIAMKGEAAGDWKRPPKDFYDRPLSGIDQVLHTIERATTLGSQDLKLQGRALNHVLLHAGFLKAGLAALAGPDPDVNTQTLLERAFPSEPARWFLRALPELTTVRPQARAALEAFRAWCQFIEPRVPWAPSRDAGQHGSRETMDGFATARSRFADVPWAMAALEASTLASEKEEDDLPEGWLRNAECSWYGLIIDDTRHVASSPPALRTLLEENAVEVLFDLEKKPVLFSVKRGILDRPVELYSLLRVKVGDHIEKLADEAGQELALDEKSEVVFQWDEVAAVLPPLEGAVLPNGAPAMLRIDDPRPPWLKEEEKYSSVIHFNE
ncbi:MAG: hypothetical protein JNM17_26150 [Archangium sp.]|nr:hypothetical protein [Archangium sp.]